MASSQLLLLVAFTNPAFLCYYKDRIDYSIIAGHRSVGEVNMCDKILPSSEDYRLLKNDFAVIISRMITAYLPFFGEDFKGLVQQHIPHKYTNEMCNKSEVVS